MLDGNLPENTRDLVRNRRHETLVQAILEDSVRCLECSIANQVELVLAIRAQLPFGVLVSQHGDRFRGDLQLLDILKIQRQECGSFGCLPSLYFSSNETPLSPIVNVPGSPT